ncbi:MAG: DM13 domain-containing protein [Acidimicrobiia bacterium]
MATKIDDRPEAPGPEPRRRPRRSWGNRVLAALPAVAFLATFGYFFVDNNEEARSVLESGRGLLTMAALFVGYVVLAFALRRLVRWAWVAPLVLTAVILALAAWIVRPYYVDETDNTRLVKEEVRDASEVEAEAEAPAPPASGEAPAPPPPAEPVRIAAGSLQGLAGHDASGGASLIRQPDGSFVVRFESFDIEGTPAPHVYLIEGTDQRNPGGLDLGDLRGNVGDGSDYAVPAGAQPAAGWTVLVWCDSFSVPITNATLTPS